MKILDNMDAEWIEAWESIFPPEIPAPTLSMTMKQIITDVILATQEMNRLETNKKQREYRKKRYHEDAEFREAIKQYNKKWWDGLTQDQKGKYS